MTNAAFRSEKREVERSRDLMARLAALPIDMAARVIQQTPNELARVEKATTGQWKDGIEPMPFDEFCFELDGMQMFERQVDAWDLPKTLRASHLFSPTRTITEWLLIWGKRSGKDFLVSKLFAYVAYVLHHFAEDPCTWMARTSGKFIAPGTRMDVVNVAPNQDLARQVFFQYMKRWLSHPIFKPFQIYPSPEKMAYGTDHISFPLIDLHLYSKTSKSSGLDGFNLLMWVMDEADEFFDNAERSNADVIHNIFRRTMNMTFGPFGAGFIISYPRYEDGFVLRMEKRFLKSPTLFYVDKAGTGAVRPDFDNNAPEIQEEREYDPEGAAAMYDCEPKAGEAVWFDMPERVIECTDDNRPPVCTVIMETPEIPVMSGGVSKLVTYVAARVEDIQREPGYTYVLTVDGGETGDAYGISIWHSDDSVDSANWLCPNCGRDPIIREFARYRQLRMSEPVILDEAQNCGLCGYLPMDVTPMSGNQWWWKKEANDTKEIKVNGQSYHVPHLFEDLLIRVKPQRAGDHKQKITVHYPTVEETITQLVIGLSVLKLRTDPHQTVSLLQGIQAKTGIDCDKLSQSIEEQAKRAKLAKLMLNAYLLTFRPNEVRNIEWRRLGRFGKRINHPPGGSKDLYDVESMAIWTLATHHCAGLSTAF